ncbi:PiggyBac transposable element-derived protein 4 [Anthophora retusa]
MSRRSKSVNLLLEKVNNIDEECSEYDQEIFDIENVGMTERECVACMNAFGCIDSNTDEDEENVSNVRRGRKRRRFLVSSDSENEEEVIETAVDGTVWQEVKEGSNPGRAPIHNIFRGTSGPTGYSKRNIMKGKVMTAFSLIIDKNIIEHIRKCTKTEAFRVLGSKWDLSTAKLHAFIALLYARGAYEAKNIDIALMWNKKWGPAFFSNIMSRNNFTEIMRKLFSTKARCRFTQYMPNKPDKFGIKFWLASDVSTSYIINGFPYLGKDERREPSVPLGEFVTLKLVEPYTGCGRNITTDNCFTNVSLVTKLLAKKTTVVGTIRANRRELPKLAKQKNDNMVRFSTKLYRSNNCTLTIYKAKPNKKVLILSSMHNSVQVEENDTRIPETIRLCNSTKFGVDVTDQMAKNYTVKSKCRRWPLQHHFANDNINWHFTPSGPAISAVYGKPRSSPLRGDLYVGSRN